MKKLFKRVSLILLTVCAVFACAFALSACGGGKDYTFYIQNADGTVCSEVYGLQICAEGTELCYPLPAEIVPDANGKVTITQAQINGWFNSETNVTAFSFHVFIETDNDILHYEFNVDGAKEYTCKLTTPVE